MALACAGRPAAVPAGTAAHSADAAAAQQDGGGVESDSEQDGEGGSEGGREGIGERDDSEVSAREDGGVVSKAANRGVPGSERLGDGRESDLEDDNWDSDSSAGDNREGGADGSGRRQEEGRMDDSSLRPFVAVMERGGGDDGEGSEESDNGGSVGNSGSSTTDRDSRDGGSDETGDQAVHTVNTADGEGAGREGEQHRRVLDWEEVSSPVRETMDEDSGLATRCPAFHCCGRNEEGRKGVEEEDREAEADITASDVEGDVRISRGDERGEGGMGVGMRSTELHADEIGGELDGRDTSRMTRQGRRRMRDGSVLPGGDLTGGCPQAARAEATGELQVEGCWLPEFVDNNERAVPQIFGCPPVVGEDGNTAADLSCMHEWDTWSLNRSALQVSAALHCTALHCCCWATVLARLYMSRQ